MKSIWFEKIKWKWKVKSIAIKNGIKIKLTTKPELKAEEDKIVKIQTYYLSPFFGQSYFVYDGAELYSILQPLHYTLKRLDDTTKDVSWKSKGLSTEKITTSTTADNIFSPSIRCYEDSNFYLIFKARDLKQIITTFTPLNIIIYFIISELDTWSRKLNSDFNLKDYLFGGVKLAENAESDKYVYGGYGIGFDSGLLFSIPNFGWGKNVIIFGVDRSSSVYINNKKRHLNSR